MEGGAAAEGSTEPGGEAEGDSQPAAGSTPPAGVEQRAGAPAKKGGSVGGIRGFFSTVPEEVSSAPPPPSLEQLQTMLPPGSILCGGGATSGNVPRIARYVDALGERLKPFFTPYNPEGDGHCMFRYTRDLHPTPRGTEELLLCLQERIESTRLKSE
jgi:hypothetical protein